MITKILIFFELKLAMVIYGYKNYREIGNHKMFGVGYWKIQDCFRDR